LVRVLSQAQYDYTAIVANLRKDDVSQDGVRKYFKRRIEDTHSEVQTLIKIQQQIGGTVVLPELRAPTKVEFETLLEVFHDALAKDKLVNKILLQLHSRILRVEQPIREAIQEIEEMVQEREQNIQQILQQILHLEQNHGQVGEFVVSKLLKEEHFRIRKVEIEELQWKYQSFEKQERSAIPKRHILTAKRPSEKKQQQLLEQQVTSFGKCFQKHQQSSKSEFARQFKSTKSFE